MVVSNKIMSLTNCNILKKAFKNGLGWCSQNNRLTSIQLNK